jgi:hypothetical protein
MRAVRKHTDYPWVLLHIERWLQAPEQMEDGSLVARERGTPQGGVVSPILSNLFLHYTFDIWMQRHHPTIPFERYADDVICHCRSEEQAKCAGSPICSLTGAFCTGAAEQWEPDEARASRPVLRARCGETPPRDSRKIYVRSERAGQRVMEGISRFITQKLKLKVNEAKSAVVRSQGRKFLGFGFTAGPDIKRTIAPKSLERFKQQIREIRRRAKGVSIKTTMEELATYCVAAILASAKRPRN